MSLDWPTILSSYTFSNKYATKLLQLDMNHQIKWLKAIAWSRLASIEYSNRDLFPFVASNKYQGIEFQSNLYWNLLKTLLCARSTFWKLLLPQWWEVNVNTMKMLDLSIQFKIPQTRGSQKVTNRIDDLTFWETRFWECEGRYWTSLILLVSFFSQSKFFFASLNL